MSGWPTSEVVLCLLVFNLCTSVSEHLVGNCPQNQTEWERESLSLQCQEPNYYHCLRDDIGQFKKLCTQRVWIQKGMCPEYNSRVRRIDVFECPSGQRGCPATIFWSNAVFLYPDCYRNSTKPLLTTIVFEKSEDITQDKIPGSGEVDDHHSDTTLLLSIGVPVLFVAVIVVVIIVFVRKRQCRGNNQHSLTLEEQITNRNQNEPRTNRYSGEQEEMLDSLTLEEQITNRNQNEPRTNRYPGEQEKMLDNRNICGAEERWAYSTIDEPNFTDLITECEKKSGVFILAILIREPLDKSSLEVKIKQKLDIPVSMQNNFKKWKSTKTEAAYVFDDWITSSDNANINDVSNVLIEVLKAVLQHNTKFVFVIPRTIWLGSADFKAIQDLRICKKFYPS